jgi:hypothetical protein
MSEEHKSHHKSHTESHSKSRRKSHTGHVVAGHIGYVKSRDMMSEGSHMP